MTQNEKFQIQRRTARRNFWQRQGGYSALPPKLLFIPLYLAGAVFVWSKQDAISAQAGRMELISPVLQAAMTHALAAYLLVGGVALAVLLVYPFGRKAAHDQLQSIGLVNHAGMAPALLRKRRDRDNPRVTVWEFQNQSIPLAAWEDERASIEAALDISVVKMT